MKHFKLFRRKLRYNSRIRFLYAILFLLLIGMSLGYAYLQTTLEINGSVAVASSTWDIHFENIDVNDGSVEATTEPSIINDISITFAAILEKPGDFYEFTADIVNDGTYNAKLDSFTVLPVLTDAETEYFEYEVTYLEGEAIQQNDALDAGTRETIRVLVRYKENINTSLYPEEDHVFEFNVGLTYIQGDGNKIAATKAPTFREGEYTNGTKTVTITFSQRCGTVYTCKYSKNGEEVAVTEKTVNVVYDSSGVIDASIDDGSNIFSSSYTVKFPSVYVSSNGNDITGYGSVASPYATLTKAYDMMSSTGTIYVMDNITYGDTATFEENKNTTITSCTKSGSDCIFSTSNSIIRGNSLTNSLITLNSGTLTFNNIIVNGNNVEANQALVLVDNSTVNINTGAVIKNGNNTSTGGGIYLIDNASLVMSNGEISHNTAVNGGGIYSAIDEENPSSISISGNSLITQNVGTTSGGGIWSAGNLLLSGGTISSNTTNSSTGGGIWSCGDMEMTGGVISSNTAGTAGGGVQNTYSNSFRYGSFVMSGGSITNNEAATGGGGIFTNGNEDNYTSLTVSGTALISGNTAGTNGAGIYSATGTFLTVNGGSVTNNTATTSGGGIYGPGTMLVSNGLINGNTATDRGGGIYSSINLKITGGTISGNEVTTTSSGYGGGVFTAGDFEMSGGSITGNTAKRYGGGIFSTADSLLSGGSVTSNEATENLGGGIRINGEFTITGGNVQNNTAPANPYSNNFSVYNNDGVSLYDSNADFTVDHTKYYIASAVSNSYVLDLTNGAVHGNIQLLQNASNNTHKWKLIPGKAVNGTIYYYIQNQAQTTQYASVGNSSSGTGVNILGWEVADLTGRYFSLDKVDSTYYNIKNITGTCVSKAGGTSAANGNNIETATCSTANINKWKFVDVDSANKYTVKFNGNGSTSGSMSNIQCTIGSNCTLTANAFARTGYTFIGWSKTASGDVQYANKEVVVDLTTSPGTTVNLYAVWRDDSKIYVSSSGNDTSGFGTITKPYKTLTKAYAQAATTANIYIMSNLTLTATTTMSSAKTITLSSCTASGSTCSYSSNYSLIRGSSFTEGYLINQSAGTLNLTNITVNGNNVSATSGLISGKKLVVKTGTTITKGKRTSGSGGGIVVASSGTLTVSGGTISNNSAASNGGGIYGSSSATITLSGGTISNNSAKKGGGVYAAVSSTTTISGATITGNSGTDTASSGGGVCALGTLKMTSGNITSNTAAGSGGGILVTSTFNFGGGSINNNTSGGIGAGVNATFSATNNTTCKMTMSGGEIKNNESTGSSGGGIYLNGDDGYTSSLTITGGTISGNTVATVGGGIRVSEFGTATITGGTISSNTSGSAGGGINSAGALTIGGTANVKSNTSDKYYSYNISSNASFTDQKASYSVSNSSVTTNYKVVTAVGTSYALDVTGGTAANGTNVQLYSYTGAAAQKWHILPDLVSNGVVYYHFESQINKTQVMDNTSNSSTSGNNVQTYAWSTGNGLRWSLTSAGSGYYYVKSYTGLCLDLAGGSVGNGKNIQAYTCNNSTAQKWKFVGV